MKVTRWKNVINKIFPITALGYLFHTQYDMGMKYFSDGQFDRALETFESALLPKGYMKPSSVS